MIRKVEPRKDSGGSITADSKKPLDRKLEETFLIIDDPISISLEWKGRVGKKRRGEERRRVYPRFRNVTRGRRRRAKE